MKAFQAFGVIIGLGLVLNVALQVSAQHLSCDDDEHLPDPPECPPPEGSGANSTYFPVPYDCRKFFECTNGVAKCIRCAPGTVWDQEQQTCDHEDYTECVIVTTPGPSTLPTTTTTTTTTPKPTTTTTTTTTTKPTTTPKPTTTSTTELPTDPPASSTTTERPWNLCPIDDPMPPPGRCPDWEETPTYFPYPYNCRKYFQCSNGVAICMRCNNVTVWNQEKCVCDLEVDVGCVIVTTPVNPSAVQEENGIVGFFKNLRFF